MDTERHFTWHTTSLEEASSTRPGKMRRSPAPRLTLRRMKVSLDEGIFRVMFHLMIGNLDGSAEVHVYLPFTTKPTLHLLFDCSQQGVRACYALP